MPGGLVSCALLVVLSSGAADAAPPPSVESRPIDGPVLALEVASDFEDSGAVLATVVRTPCEQDCLELHELDATTGRSVRHAAAGWAGGEVATLRSGDRVLLYSRTDRSVQVSTDRGETFADTDLPVGNVSAASDSAGERSFLVIASDDEQHRFAPPSSLEAIPGTDLLNPVFHTNPALHNRREGRPQALASGVDPVTRLPAVDVCDGALRCRRSGAVGTAPNVYPFVHLSPNYDVDRTLFARLSDGRVFRSTDDGRTFAPVVIDADAARGDQFSVQDLGFTPDFDTSTGSGRMYAAVIAVTPTGTSGEGLLRGGVYESRDRGVTWRRIGVGSKLDNGASVVTVAPNGRVIAGYLDPSPERIGGGLLCLRSDGAAEACGPLSDPIAATAGPQPLPAPVDAVVGGPAGTPPVTTGDGPGAATSAESEPRSGSGTATGAPIGARERAEPSRAAPSPSGRRGPSLPVVVVATAVAVAASVAAVRTRRRIPSATSLDRSWARTDSDVDARPRAARDGP